MLVFYCKHTVVKKHKNNKENQSWSVSIILGSKLTSAAHTLVMELTYGFIVNTPLKMPKHFSFLISRSTWTWGLAILLVAVEALDEIAAFLIIGGASNLVS